MHKSLRNPRGSFSVTVFHSSHQMFPSSGRLSEFSCELLLLEGKRTRSDLRAQQRDSSYHPGERMFHCGIMVTMVSPSKRPDPGT